MDHGPLLLAEPEHGAAVSLSAVLELILVFDNDTPYGFVAGVQAVYKDGETDTVAKALGLMAWPVW